PGRQRHQLAVAVRVPQRDPGHALRLRVGAVDADVPDHLHHGVRHGEAARRESHGDTGEGGEVMATTTATAPGRTRTRGTRGTGGGRGGDERRVWSKVGLAVGVLLIAAYCLAPFYWMVVSSLKGQNDIFDNSLLPKHATMTNFRAV